MKGLPKYILLFLSALLLQSCITIEEHYEFKKNGSGNMIYSVDMSDLGEMLDGMANMVDDEEDEEEGDSGRPDLGSLLESDGEFKFLKAKSEIEAVPGISKVETLHEEHKGSISFKFKNIEALNAALNLIQPDTSGVEHTFFTLEDGVLKRTHNNTSELSSDPEEGEEAQLGIFKQMEYNLTVKSKRIRTLSSDSKADVKQLGPKEVRVKSNMKQIIEDPRTLDLTFDLNK